MAFFWILVEIFNHFLNYPKYNEVFIFDILASKSESPPPRKIAKMAYFEHFCLSQ